MEERYFLRNRLMRGCDVAKGAFHHSPSVFSCSSTFFLSFFLSVQGFLPPMLVFVQSIERARELFHELVYEGINVDIIHADRTQQQVRTQEGPRSHTSSGLSHCKTFTTKWYSHTFSFCLYLFTFLSLLFSFALPLRERTL